MSSYFNTLQDEEYRPSSRATNQTRSSSARRSRQHQQQQQQQQQQPPGRSSSEDSSSSSGTDHLEGSSSYDDSDRFDKEPRAQYHYHRTEDTSPARQPVGRTPSKNLAHHHRASVPKSTSRHSTVNMDKGTATTTTSQEGGHRKNGKTAKASKTKNGKAKNAIKVKQTGGKKIRDSDDDDEASADYIIRQNDTQSERSSIYSRERYDRKEKEEDDDDPFRSSDHPRSKSRQRNNRDPSIYDAYRRLSIVGPSHASVREDNEEEHSSNNAYSQQTPATSSTQPSSATEDDDTMLNQSPSSHNQQSAPSKQRNTTKRKKKKQPPGSSVSGASKSSRSHTTDGSNDASQGKATTKKKKQPASPTSTEDAPYQRKNSKNSRSSRGKREKSGNNSAAMDRSSNSSVPKQLHVVEELAQPSLYGDDPAILVAEDDIIASEEVKPVPTRSTDLSPTSNRKTSFALKDNLHSGDLVPHYSNRMLEVKDSLRDDIEVPKTKKNKKRRGSATSVSSSASGSSGFGIMEFLHNKVPGRTHLSEEERRRRGNPFLNRPKSFKKYTGVGLNEHPDDDSSHNENTGRRGSMVAGNDFDEFSDDESHDHNGHLTLQEKYCPLPKPIRLLQRFCAKIVTNQEFQIVMVVLIMLNALILGIATYQFSNPAVPEALDVMDRMLLVIFTIELALQFGYCGYTLLLDGWLVFDTLTVVTSWWLEGVQVFRSFRIFRSFRLIVRLPLLKNLVLTVFHVMPRIYSILSLLILILYIFGVLCTILFGDLYNDGFTDTNYFGRLDYSVFTLFQMVTLEGWGDIVRQVGAVHEFYASMIFSIFIVVTGFIMYNLIVAVMCDSMLVVEAQAREEARELKKQKRALAERAIEQEEKKLEEEMNRQRMLEKQARERIKGVVNDDPSTDNKDGNTLATMDSICEEDSVVPMREHMCDRCGFCSEIPILPASVRRRNRERDRSLEDNQARVEGLKQKLDQLVGTQQQVTAVLQTLMFQIEAQRKAQVKTQHGNTSVTSRPETTETSTGSSRFTSW